MFHIPKQIVYILRILSIFSGLFEGGGGGLLERGGGEYLRRRLIYFLVKLYNFLPAQRNVSKQLCILTILIAVSLLTIYFLLTRSLTFKLSKLKSTGGREEKISYQSQGTQTGTCLKWFVHSVTL